MLTSVGVIAFYIYIHLESGEGRKEKGKENYLMSQAKK